MNFEVINKNSALTLCACMKRVRMWQIWSHIAIAIASLALYVHITLTNAKYIWTLYLK